MIRSVQAKNGTVFEASVTPGYGFIDVETPKAKGYKSAHRKLAKRFGAVKLNLTLIHTEHSTDTKSVTTRWSK